MTCHTCELIARRDAGKAPFWDSFYRTEYWDLVHRYDSTLEGWLVLILRRHAAALDELSSEEAIELGSLLRKASIALKEVTGCVKAYVIQFAEHPEHPHVHFHIVPRAKDMPMEYRSTKIFGYTAASEADKVPETVMNALVTRLLGYL